MLFTYRGWRGQVYFFTHVDYYVNLRLQVRGVGEKTQRDYSVPRVSECLTHRRNWVHLPPPPQASVSLLGHKEGKQHSLAVEGVGGPNSDDWIESLALCSVYSVINNVYNVENI
jgi:hypothetical protein